MRLSSGVAEINLGRAQGAGSATKAFIWPAYNDNKVSSVRRVSSHAGGEIYYTKATDEFKEQLLDAVKRVPQSKYYSGGKADLLIAGYEPGILFNALA